MIDRIANIEKASADIRNYFKSILEGRLLSIDVDSISDEELLSSLPDGISVKDQGPRFIDNLCSWISIGKSKEEIYYRPYMQIHLLLTEGKDMDFCMNYSRFRYPLDLNREKYVIFANRSGISTIDDKEINPDTYFQEYYEEKLFFICAFTGIDAYGNKRMGAYFAKEEMSPIHVRRYILEAQLTALIEILNESVDYGHLPSADIIRECDGGPYYFRDVWYNSCIRDLAIKIYNEEFIDVFKSKYEKTLLKYYDFCEHHKEIVI